MSWAREEVERGRAGAGAAFVADAQTDGRGRHGRSWASVPGKGLYLTVVLPGSLAAPSLTLAAALAVAEAVEEATGVSPELKWPNDLLVGGRKLGGVLAEVVPSADDTAVLLGVGINVTHDEQDFGPELAPRATSVRLAGGACGGPGQLLPAMLDRLGARLADFERHGFGSLVEPFLSRSVFRPGDRLEIAREGQPDWPATFRGLDAEGRLLVEESPQPLASGTVLRVRRGGAS